jgi:ribosomal protein S18 acetylase RimI-like enzyme
MEPLLRPALLEDVERLAAFKLETFRETFLDGFAIPYPPEDLAQFEAASYSPAAVAGELADSGRMNWVVEADGRLVAYAQVGPCKLPHAEVKEGEGELYQIYVRGQAQGLGLGKRLLTTALDHLAATRPGSVWLGVWSGNHKAQAVYRKIGFEKVGDYQFPVGSWRDEEYIFRR